MVGEDTTPREGTRTTQTKEPSPRAPKVGHNTVLVSPPYLPIDLHSRKALPVRCGDLYSAGGPFVMQGGGASFTRWIMYGSHFNCEGLQTIGQ